MVNIRNIQVKYGVSFIFNFFTYSLFFFFFLLTKDEKPQQRPAAKKAYPLKNSSPFLPVANFSGETKRNRQHSLMRAGC